MADAILAQSGIYTITNLVSKKQYVGSSTELSRRKYSHFWHLRRGDHRNAKLQNAWNKYGESAFVFDVIEYLDDESSVLGREQYWIDKLNVTGRFGYNIVITAGRTTGYLHTEETKKKMAIARRAQERGPVSAATKALISASLMNPSAERRAAISESLKGQVFSDARREKIRAARAAQVMRPVSDETKAKISAAHKGRKHTDEARSRMAAAQKGKVVSRDRIEALAAFNRGVPRSDEIRAKISASHLARRKRIIESIAADLKV